MSAEKLQGNRKKLHLQIDCKCPQVCCINRYSKELVWERDARGVDIGHLNLHWLCRPHSDQVLPLEEKSLSRIQSIHDTRTTAKMRQHTQAAGETVCVPIYFDLDIIYRLLLSLLLLLLVLLPELLLIMIEQHCCSLHFLSVKQDLNMHF